MKNFHHLLALLCLLISITHASAQWQQCAGPPSTYATCIERVNSRLLAGTQGGVYSSTDDGITWVAVPDLKGKITDILYHNSVLMIAYLRDDDNIACVKTSYNEGQSWTTTVIEQYVSYCPYMDLIPLGDAVILNDYSNYIFTLSYGTTWQQLSLPYGRTYLQALSTDNNSMVATFLNSNFDKSVLFVCSGIGAPWKYIDSSGLIYSTYIQDSTIIVSRSHNNGFFWKTRLCRSENLGATWDTIYVVPDSSIIQNFNQFGNKLYASGTGKTYSSIDVGNTWGYDTMPFNYFLDKVILANGNELGSHYPEGLLEYNPTSNTTQPRINGIYPHYVYTMANNNNILYASTEQDVFVSHDEGNTWAFAGVPQTGITDFQFSGDTVMGVTDQMLLTSFDNGTTWDFHSLYPHSGVDFKTIEYENGKVYLSSDSIKYSTDFGVTWHALPPLPDNSNPNITHPKFTGVIEMFHHSLYAVNENGFIFRYSEQQNNWTTVFTAPACIHNELYTLDNALVMSGYNQFWVTYDDGATWSTPAMQGLPTLTTPHNLVVVNGLWLGTCEQYGVYASSDSGNSWRPFYDGGSPFRASKRGGITVMNNKLFAGTHYQSVWKYDGAIEMPTSIEKTPAASVSVYPNPATDVLFIDFSEALTATVTLYNVNGEVAKKETVSGNRASLKISGLPSGIYTGALTTAPGQYSIYRFIINR